MHFLVLGAALFALYDVIGRPESAADVTGEIVVTQARVRSLIETFGRQWGRSPSGEELSGLVRDFVREEALAREALALGLDRDDTVVRRRLAQKMEFLSLDLAGTGAPDDEDLRAFMAAHPERFRVGSVLTFTQIFFDRGKRGAALERDAETLLVALRGADPPGDVAGLGDTRLLDPRQENVSQHDVAATFGVAFAARLDELPLGRWEGPIASDYGAHLVRVERRVPGHAPALDEVRELVVREWTATRRDDMKHAQLEAILARYRVTVEPSAPTAGVPDVIAKLRP